MSDQPKPRKEDAATPTGEWREKVDWLKSQLKLSNDALSPCQQEIQQLREQLDAERGNTKQLVEALKDIRVGAPDVVQQQIKYALAKVENDFGSTMR